MDKLIKPTRIATIILFILVIITVFILALYNLQIIGGATYSSENQRLSTANMTIPAARGSIIDRYGHVLVSDRVCYNVVIDRAKLLSSPNPNDAILRLISAASSCGLSYTDTLPMTAEHYSPSMTDSQTSRLSAYREYFELSEDISAGEMLEFFRKHYKIDPSISDSDARLISGVRYELEIRLIVNISDYVFAYDVGIDFISILAEQDFPGIDTVTGFTRVYNTSYAAHVLGNVGLMDEKEIAYYTRLGYPMNATIGKGGVEKGFEEYLHGTDGTVAVTTNSSGAVVDVQTVTEAKPGSNVVLTLDIGLQEAAEKALESTISRINNSRGPDLEQAEVGAVVAVDVNSGDVLASASYPSYDLSTFSEDYSKLLENELKPLFNRATQGTYSPGSTFKMVTAIAALEEGIIDPDDTITDQGIYTKYSSSGFSPRCWIYPGSHGAINVVEALEVSCNYFFYTMGDNLGINLLSSYAASFGLGQSTGIEIYEETGILASREYKDSLGGEPWYPGDTLQASIGQSYNLFTPLQLSIYTAALANGGTRYAATLLDTVKSYDYSAPVYTQQARILSTVEADSLYFETAREGMLAVSQEGSISSVFSNYIVDVAAKTGTAQIGENRTNNGIFVCFAPFDDPQIAIAVVVEKGGSGTAISSLARDVLDYYFRSKAATDTISPENTLLW